MICRESLPRDGATRRRYKCPACKKWLTSYEFATEDPKLIPLVLSLDPGQRDALEGFLRTLGRQNK